MILSTLTLKNFKKHKSLTLHFTPGSNLIVGPNYAGKSTIMHAIMVALWGSSAVEQVSTELVSDGEKDFLVELVFSTGHTLSRTLKNASLSRAGEEPYARGHSAVNKAVVELLSVNRDVFSKVFASEQGATERLLQMEGAELQRFIESLIGLEKLDAVVKECNRRVTHAKSCTEALESMVLSPDQLVETRSRLQRYQLDLEQAKEQEATLRDKYEATKQLWDAKQRELAEAVASNHTLEIYRVARDNLIDRIGGRVQKQLPDITMLEASYTEAKKKLGQLEYQQKEQHQINLAHASYQAKLKEWETQLMATPDRTHEIFLLSGALERLQKQHEEAEALEKRIYEVTRDREYADKALSLVEGMISKLDPIPEDYSEDAYVEASNEYDRLHRELRAAQSMLHDAVCPTCHREMEGVSKAALEEQIAILKKASSVASDTYQRMKRAKELSAQHIRLHADRQTALNTLSSLPEAPQAPEVTSKEISRMQSDTKVQLNTLKAEATRRESLEKALSTLAKPEGEPCSEFEDLTPYREAYRIAASELESAEKVRAAQLKDNQELAKLEESLQQLVPPEVTQVVNTQALEQQVATYGKDLDNLLADLDRATQDGHRAELILQPLISSLEQHEIAYAKCQEHFKTADNCRYISQVLTNSRDTFVSRATATILGVATEFAKLSTDGDISEVALHEGTLKYQEGDRLRTKASASGAQKAIINLGMKLGVANLIRTPFAALLLDEVGAAMSDEISLQASLALGSLCEQSIAISHRKLDVAGNVIEL